MPSLLVSGCCKALADRGWNIAFIESATAGRMCSEFALSEFSGNVLRGGLACYEVFVKENILRVPDWVISKYTPESAETTESLAVHGAAFFESDVVVAITGLTTPGGSENAEKPVGTMFIHIIFPEGAIAHREVFSGNPEQIMLAAIDKAATLLTEVVA